MLNKQKGNMYGFVTHTWNVIKGKCPHDCSYCYMKEFPQGALRFDEKELKTDLGEGNFIFVGSSCDMFAKDVPRLWIETIISHCNEYPNNTYLFQTKDPYNFFKFRGLFMDNTILGTTIESNRDTPSKAPHTKERKDAMKYLSSKKMITIEPIMDFDLDILVDWIKNTRPEFVNIGADSKEHNLPEPSWYKVKLLIEELEKFTKVNLKYNLDRLKR